jgi:hypothetical protein
MDSQDRKYKKSTRQKMLCANFQDIDASLLLQTPGKVTWISYHNTPQPKSTSPHCLVEEFLEHCLRLQAETS